MDNKKEEKIKEPKQDEELVIEEIEGSLSPEDKIKKLKKELSLCLKEKAEYLEGWQRAKADFINARKEEEKFREEFMNLACRELIKELLPLADSFEMAFDNKEVWSKIDLKWREGLENIYKQLLQLFESHKVTAIIAKGENFNPLEQESLEEVEVNDEKLDKVVLEEVQKGYKMHNYVLRPVKVKVGVYKNKI